MDLKGIQHRRSVSAGQIEPLLRSLCQPRYSIVIELNRSVDTTLPSWHWVAVSSTLLSAQQESARSLLQSIGWHVTRSAGA